MLPKLGARLRSFAFGCLLAAIVLIPGSFMLGGAVIHVGDPGVGMALLSLGVVFQLIGIFLITRGSDRAPGAGGKDHRA